MITIIYGEGLAQTQQGVTNDEVKNRCLVISKRGTAAPVGSIPTVWDKERPEDTIDVLLVFKTLESARTVQDELNELISIWSRESAPKHEGR